MARYIDADAFEKQLNRYVEYNDDGEQEINADEVFITLHEQPTADVVERKKGEWLNHDSSCYTLNRICSLCGKVVHEHGWNFCPNCGAKMKVRHIFM